MKRKLVGVLAGVLALALMVPTAFAALTDQQKQEIGALEKQILELRKQVIDKRMEGGEITADQAQRMKERMDAHYQQMEKNGFAAGPGMGKGFGRGGKGFGKGPCQGFGKAENGQGSQAPAQQ